MRCNSSWGTKSYVHNKGSVHHYLHHIQLEWLYFYVWYSLRLCNLFQFIGRVHPQNICFKYVMLRTVTTNSTIIIMKYTWYHKYKVIIPITRGSPLRLHRKSDSKAGKVQTEMLWRHIGNLYSDANYGFYWALISGPFDSSSSGQVPSGSHWNGYMSFMSLITRLRYVLEQLRWSQRYILLVLFGNNIKNSKENIRNSVQDIYQGPSGQWKLLN